MRLINTTTLEMQEFLGAATTPAYAILSHTWEEDEVSYQDFVQQRSTTQKKKGFLKIEKTCHLARESGIEYAWVDACCIDKTSSAELTEAINSMFEWYAASTVCYTFLSDLPPTDHADNPALDDSDLSKCRWFTRGWTLQELLAPPALVFYDANWQPRGAKVDISPALASVTGIDENVLVDCTQLTTFTVARRMSWAAGRRTTKTEDLAYSLLGIFGVNMPLIYGEGEKAFIRLQEAIARETNDLTLFAWQADTSNSSAGSQQPAQKYRGILAQRPDDFAAMGAIDSSRDVRFNDEFSVTNKGFKLDARLINATDSGSYILKLNCHRVEKPEVIIGIFLKRHGDGLYARDRPYELAELTDGKDERSQAIYISKIVTPVLSATIAGDHRHAIHFRDGFADSPYFTWSRSTPKGIWDAQRQLFLTNGLPSFVGYGYFTSSNHTKYHIFGRAFMIVCGVAASGPWVSFCNVNDAGVTAALMKEDLDSLGKVVYQRQCKTLFFEEREGSARYNPTKQLTATISLTKSVLDNEPIYCVDMVVEDSK